MNADAIVDENSSADHEATSAFTGARRIAVDIQSRHMKRLVDADIRILKTQQRRT